MVSRLIPPPAQETPEAGAESESDGDADPDAGPDVEASGPLDAPLEEEGGPAAQRLRAEEPEKPSIDTVMGGLVPASVGAVLTRPEAHLTGEQAELQNRLYVTLAAQGLTLRSQGDVYGWILGQMLEHLG